MTKRKSGRKGSVRDGNAKRYTIEEVHKKLYPNGPPPRVSLKELTVFRLGNRGVPYAAIHETLHAARLVADLHERAWSFKSGTRVLELPGIRRKYTAAGEALEALYQAIGAALGRTTPRRRS